ncbi:hypothetical protein [Kineosporia babensis]|uniref:Lipoprotein n=1 Tax=Kineosporia babensis TaxID=499548 RepID=A0A9X1SZD1_9ACTN|nr:hypothetical protein [Kineosporia babensis]MCD5311893.1 hypothetical protein [Kineosporia babensis]
MFRARHSVLKAAVAIPVAALLLAGCGDGGDDEPADQASPSATQEATATPESTPSEESSPAAVDTSAALDELNAQLEQAAEQAGPEGFGAITCESVKGGVMGVTGGAADEAAVAEGLGQVLESVLKGAQRSSDSIKDADLDSTMEEQCPDVRADALKAAGAESMEDLLSK